MASTCFRLACRQLRQFTSRGYRSVSPSLRKRCFPVLAIGVAFCESNFKTSDKKEEFEEMMQSPEMSSTLTTEHLIRNASLVAIDAATTLLTQTTTALLDLEKEYAKALDTLVTLMEFKLTILDEKVEMEKIWDYILAVRGKLNRLRRIRQNMKMMHTSASNLVNSAAEVAFMSGSEYKGILANEILQSCERELQQSEKSILREEKRLQDIELQTIKAETQHAEQQEKKEKQRQEERLLVEKTEAEKISPDSEKIPDKTNGQNEFVGAKVSKHFILREKDDMEQVFNTEEEWQKDQRDSEGL